MDNECAGSIGISDTELRSGSGMLSRTKFSHLGNSSSGESQRTVTLRICQICEQMMCYPVIVDRIR